MKKHVLFKALLCLLLSIVGLNSMWAETKTEGFESATTGTNYQSTVTIDSQKSDCGIGWTIYYGNVTTSNKITGNNSVGLRLYTSKNYGYIKSTTPVDGLSKVSFKAKAQESNGATVKIDVASSTDGSNWTTIKSSEAISSTMTTHEYDITSGHKYIQISISSNSTNPSKGNVQLTIDDIALTIGSETPKTDITNTIETAYTITQAKNFINNESTYDISKNVYVKGTVSQIDSYNSTYGSITYWISEDGTTTNQFEVYGGLAMGSNAKFSAKEDLTVGDDVIVYGVIKKYNSTYEFDKNNYLAKWDKVATLSIADITVANGDDISPVITTNITGEYLIEYVSDNEDVVIAVDDEMVTEGVGTATITATIVADGYKTAKTTFAITVTAAGKTVPTIALNDHATELVVGGEYDTFTITYEGDGTLSVVSSEETVATVTLTDKKVTVKPVGAGATTITVSATEGDTYAAATPVSFDLAVIEKHTATFWNNGTQIGEAQSLKEGDAIVFPSNPTPANSDYTFVGWCTNTVSTTDDAPSMVSSANMSDADVNFYAVFAIADEGGSAIILSEEFDNNTTADATSEINGSKFANFTGATSKAYTSKFGGLKFGSGSAAGYITSKELDLSQPFTVTVKVKGWTSVEGNLEVTVDGTTKTYSYTATSGDDYETATFTFDAATSSSTIKIGTSAKRAYIDDVIVTSGSGATYTGYTTSLVVKTKLDTPANLTASNISTTSATLSWDAVENADSYLVKIGENEYEASTNSYEATEFTANTQYTWTVKAVAADDNESFNTGDYAESVNFTTEAVTYTVTIVTPENGSLVVMNGENVVNNGDAIADGTTLTITATPADDYKFRNWQAVDGTTHTYTTTFEYTINGKNVTFKANFDVLEPYAVTFYVNGDVTEKTETGVHAGVTVPNDITAPTGYTFEGWVLTAIDGETTAPQGYVTVTENMYYPTENCTLYAVYSRDGEGGTDGGIYRVYGEVSGTKYYMQGVPAKLGQSTVVNGLSSTTDKNNAGSYAIVQNPENENQFGITYQDGDNTYYLFTERTGTSSNYNYNLTSSTNIYYFTRSTGNNYQNGEYRFTDAYDRVLSFRAGSNNWFRVYNSNNWKETNTEYFDLNLELVEGGGGETTYYATTIPVYTAANLTLVATANDSYYATFSNAAVTFFPTSGVEVQTVNVTDHLQVLDVNTLTPTTVKVGGTETEGYFVPANTGVLIKADGNSVSYYTVANKNIDEIPESDNKLHPASEEMTANSNYYFYKLAYNDYANSKGLGFWYGAKNGGTFSCKDGTAYLKVPVNTSTPVKGFALNGDEETGIATPMLNETLREQAIYDLSGRKVSKAQKGIYIVNGKKVLK